MGIWRTLSDEEKLDFKNWARSQFKSGDTINPTWHPVVQQECQEINMEKGVCRLCASKNVDATSENGFCDTCNFWFRKANLQGSKRNEVIIIDGFYYTIPEYEDVCGERNQINFHNGEVIHVNQLNWFGKIPEQFRMLMVDNAVFA